MAPVISRFAAGKSVETTISTGSRDVRELRLHLRALILQLQRVDALPSLLVFRGDHIHQAVDHALFCGRKVPPFNARLELSDATDYEVSMTPKTNAGSQTTRPLPRKGLIATILKLVGTANSRKNAL